MSLELYEFARGAEVIAKICALEYRLQRARTYHHVTTSFYSLAELK